MTTSLSRYLVHHHLVGDAAQCRFLLDRPESRFLQNGGDRRGIDHRRSDVDLLRGRQALHACSDIDGLAEVILPLVQHYREAWALMAADLDHQILLAALCI